MQMSESPQVLASGPNPPPRYAGFFVRAMADAVDSLFLDFSTLLFILILIGIQYSWKLAHAEKDLEFGYLIFEAVNSTFLQVFLVLTRGTLTLVYFTFGTIRARSTLGKRLFGVRVVDAVSLGEVSISQALTRCISYGLSYAPFGAGFFMAALHPEKKGLHDLIAKTVSVRVDRA